MNSKLRLLSKASVIEGAEIYFANVANLIIDSDNNSQYLLRLMDKSEIIAAKAESCLLMPEVGDLVLLTAGGNDQAAFILHILSRTSNAKVVDLGKDACLQAENLRLTGRSQLDIEAMQVNLSGFSGSAKFSQASLLSNWCEVRTKKALFIAQSVERIISTVSEKIGNLFKTIAGIEYTKVNRVKTLVSGRLFYKAKHVTMNAEEDVAIDGKKINIG